MTAPRRTDHPAPRGRGAPILLGALLLASTTPALPPLHAAGTPATVTVTDALRTADPTPADGPTDAFIDLLRYRLGHPVIRSFSTVSNGKPQIEAATIVEAQPADVLALFAETFAAEGLPFRITGLTPELPIFGVFRGQLDGLEKRALVMWDPESKVSRVRLYSEQYLPPGARAPSLLDDFPELEDLARELSGPTGVYSIREYDHRPGKQAVLELSSPRSPASAADLIRRTLSERGWHTQAPAETTGPFSTYSRNGWDATVGLTATPGGSAAIITITGR